MSLGFLLILLSLGYLHPVSSKRGPHINLSHQKGGDLRGSDLRLQQTRTRIHGIYKSFYPANHRFWEQRQGSLYIVPYTIEGEYDQEEKDNITAAMKLIQHNTCIRFKKWRRESSYVKIQNKQDEGCFADTSSISPMIVNLEASESGTCMDIETVLHELLHALGLEHEHQRPDRDEYIKLIEENIEPGERDQYNKLTERNMATFGLPYDYESVMHYEKTAFGINGTITMKTMDPLFQDVIGTVKDASSEDYYKVCKIYGCEKCRGSKRAEKYVEESKRNSKKIPRLTLSYHGCEDNEGQETCEQLLMNRELNCAKDEDKARCGCTCSAYYKNYERMSFYLLPIRKRRAEYIQKSDCKDSDQWRCEMQLMLKKLDCTEDTEAADCCVTCSSYRDYMHSD